MHIFKKKITSNFLINQANKKKILQSKKSRAAILKCVSIVFVLILVFIFVSIKTIPFFFNKKYK